MNAIITALTVVSSVLLLAPVVHLYQLESYQTPGTWHAIRRNARALWLRLLPLWALGMALSLLPGWGKLAVILAVAAGSGFFLCRWKKAPAKKPLAYTARVKRLYGVYAVLTVVLGLLIHLLSLPLTGKVMLGVSLGILAQPFLLILAGWIAKPMEKAVASWYIRDAEKKLAALKDCRRVGITGSYGKTSCKMILTTILAEKYRVLTTPGSFNTSLGVTRAIREHLSADTQVFVAEMGARHVKDIKKICDIVHPQFGLITSVGPQHLETFGTQERINSTKYELIEALPADGAAFFPADGGICDDLARKTRTVKAQRFGLEGENLSMRAENLESGPWGSRFTLTDGKESVACETRLLGRHNVMNITGCAAVAREMGLSMAEIASGIGKLTPVEHRLQLLPGANGVTVIDDAFNSNPKGAAAAMEVLSSFPGRHIVITPGLVELGEKEHEENRLLGEHMAKAADEAILVAGNAADMKAGLEEEGFSDEHIRVVPTLAKASQVLAEIVRPGDTVLFENDLPDQYEGR